FHVIINFSIILILLTTIACFIFPVKNIELTPEHREALSKWNFDSFVEKKVLFITFIAFLMGLAYSSVLSFLSSYVKVIDLVDVSTFFFIVYAVVITLTRPSTGRIFDVKGERYVMYPSYIFLTLGLFLLSMTTSGWMLLVSGGLIGLGYGTFMSNGQAVCLQESPSPHRIGIALSTYFIGLDLGLGVGPYVLGELRNFMSFQQMYFLAGCIPIVCTILYMVFHKAKNDAKDLSLETIEEIEHGSEL
ncbi:MFS transporter, partial [Enterococcus faecium]